MDAQELSIFNERARKLAVKEITNEEASPTIEGVLFTLGDEQYLIESQYIEEVYPLKEYTIIPLSPRYIFGLINIRRRVVCVINLKAFFNTPNSKKPINPKVIILENDTRSFAILADTVIGKILVEEKNIQNSLPTISGFHQEITRGFTHDGITLLDGEKLLSTSKIRVDEKVG